MNTASASTYYDFQGLAALRAQAVQTPKEAMHEVAGQFESLFVQMMLKSMRDATIEGGLFDSNQMELYQSMMDQQVSLQLSSQGALGLSDILVEQLDGGGSFDPKPEEPDSGAGSLSGLLSLVRRPVSVDTANVVPQVLPRVGSPAPVSAPAAPPASGDDSPHWQPSSPEEFIRGVWDHARDAAEKIGLDPLVLVAQSALETGWGKKVIKTMDDASSFNLFGIKAGKGWQGRSATVNTLEYRDGVAQLEKASFRVYDSIASSFNDYVEFLQTNSRYREALEKVSDSGEYLHGLQDAGYATDPAYAEKILEIIGSTGESPVMQELKKFNNPPITG